MVEEPKAEFRTGVIGSTKRLGLVKVDLLRSFTVGIRNAGLSSFEIGTVAVSGLDADTVKVAFVLSLVAYGKTREFKVTFSPKSKKECSAVVTVRSNSSELNGTAVYRIKVIGTGN